MYRKIRTIFVACLYYSGLVRLVRWWIRQQGPRLIIMNYHSATGGNLRQHLLYLRQHYHLLHLNEALEELLTPLPQKMRYRRTPMVITFDDGYYDNYTYGMALAHELQIPFTIFLIPGYIETGNRFWWEEPKYLVTHAGVSEVEIEGRTYHLTKPRERRALTRAIDTRIRFAPSVDEREKYLSKVRQFLRVPYAVELAEKNNVPISWTEVEAMKKSKWISFGGHTMHHPLLGYLADPNEAEYETRESRNVLEERLESPVCSFAYPVGRSRDIRTQGVRSVQNAGYTWAVTTIGGINTPRTNPYLLHRFGVDVQEDCLLLAAKATGIWTFLTNLIIIPMEFLQRLAR